MGKFSKVLDAGLNFKIPFLDAVPYQISMKEQVLEIKNQNAITKDNVKLQIDGILYYKIESAERACYNVNTPVRALALLAQTAMRSEIGLLDLDTTFKERELLNTNIRTHLEHTSIGWGIQCMRYEIKDITPPDKIREAMDLQAEAE